MKRLPVGAYDSFSLVLDHQETLPLHVPQWAQRAIIEIKNKGEMPQNRPSLGASLNPFGLAFYNASCQQSPSRRSSAF